MSASEANPLAYAMAAALDKGGDRLLSFYGFDGLEAQLSFAELDRPRPPGLGVGEAPWSCTAC